MRLEETATPPPVSSGPLIAAHGLCKAFGRTPVLRDVSFSLRGGEVLALVGENGAGKSTLMNVLSGNLPYDRGRIAFDGQDYRPSGPAEAGRRGVAIAHQETALMPDLTVAENVYFRREPRNALGLIRQRRMLVECGALLADLGFAIEARDLARTLAPAARQMVEIAKAVARQPKVLILDEPTASLSARAAGTVHALMTRLRSQGTSVIFISHRLTEIMEAADRVVVLKDGALTLEALRGAFDRDDLIQAMVGRRLSTMFPPRPAPTAAAGPSHPVLSLEGAGNALLPPIDLSVRRGEILGIAGLEGQGQKPLADALSGSKPFTNGRVRIGSSPTSLASPAAAIAAGIASIPDDHKHDGLALGLPIRMNMSFFTLAQGARLGFLPLAREKTFSEAARRRLAIRSTDLEQPVGQLSGGNQQKVVFARWLASEPKLLVLHEPTKGVDIEAKREIYHLVADLAREGVGVIVISSDLVELIGLSDRILTLYEGHVTGDIARADFSEATILRHASGRPAETREATLA